MERRTLSDLYSEQVRRLAESESFTITWTKDGVVLPEYANQTKVVISPEETGFEHAEGGREGGETSALGHSTYEANVRFHTPEVRLDKEGHLRDRMKIVVGW